MSFSSRVSTAAAAINLAAATFSFSAPSIEPQPALPITRNVVKADQAFRSDSNFNDLLQNLPGRAVSVTLYDAVHGAKPRATVIVPRDHAEAFLQTLQQVMRERDSGHLGTAENGNSGSISTTELRNFYSSKFPIAREFPFAAIFVLDCYAGNQVTVFVNGLSDTDLARPEKIDRLNRTWRTDWISPEAFFNEERKNKIVEEAQEKRYHAQEQKQKFTNQILGWIEGGLAAIIILGCVFWKSGKEKEGKQN